MNESSGLVRQCIQDLHIDDFPRFCRSGSKLDLDGNVARFLCDTIPYSIL